MESGINEFFRQLPTGFIVMFCGSGILLVFAIVYMVRARAQRVAALGTMPGGADKPTATSAPMSDAEMADLPELDELASAEIARTPLQAAGTHRLYLTDGGTSDAVEVLTILRDVADGGLIIRIGDKAYRNPPAVADAEFKRRFHTTLRDLNGAQQPVAAAPLPEPPETSAAAEELGEATDPTLNDPVPPIRRSSSFEPAPGDLPKFRMPDAPVKPKRGQRPVQEPIPEIDVAGAIEAFLQHKLSMTPQYASRSIHVRGALHGGVTIEVDGKFFETVGEVDDTAVRQFLSATIEEWQARQ